MCIFATFMQMICIADIGHKVDEMTTRGANGANVATNGRQKGDQPRQVTTTAVSFMWGIMMFPDFIRNSDKEVPSSDP